MNTIEPVSYSPAIPDQLEEDSRFESKRECVSESSVRPGQLDRGDFEAHAQKKMCIVNDPPLQTSWREVRLKSFQRSVRASA
jgi:hypothetical protein